MTRQELHVALVRLARERLGSPFAWGSMDCNTLALEFLDLLTGGDLRSEVAGRYATELGAVRFWRRFRLRWISGLADAYGAVEVPRGFVATGDFIIVELDRFQSAHVCHTPGRIVAADPEHGVHERRLSASDPFRAFRLPAWGGA